MKNKNSQPAKKFFSKLTIFALVFLFVFQPLVPIFAQQLDLGDVQVLSEPAVTTPETPAITPDPTPALDVVIPETTAIDQMTDQAVLPNETADTEPKIAENSDVKILSENEGGQAPDPAKQPTQKLPEIDKNTGALSYNYPIAVPSGRNNLQPDLSLSYNSNLNAQNSIFGYGWALNIPYIQRLNKAGTDSLYSSNYFYSSLDGELASVDGTQYIARTENGSFNKYNFSNNQWTLIAKNGTQYKFGYDAVSRQDDLANANNVYKWMLQEVRDTNDNYISYSYFKDAGQIYPSAIKYTGKGSTDGIFEIDFQRSARSDNNTSYSTGFAVNSNYLISEINSKINGSWVSKYVLSYTTGKNGKKALLNSVVVSAKDSSGTTTTLPATSFNYQNQITGFTSADVSWNIPSPPAGYEWNLYSRPPQFADLNGDGLPDLIMVGQTIVYNNGHYHKDFQYLNNGAGWTQTTAWQFPPLPAGETDWQYPNVPPQFTDLNGDGLADLVLVASHYQFGNVRAYYKYLNTGSGWAQISLWDFPPIPEGETDWQYPSIPPQFTDLNGDGLTDLVLVASHYQFGNVRAYYKYLNTGSGWAQISLWDFPPIPEGETDWQYPSIPPQFTDLNGDGLTDLVLVASHNNYGNILKDYEYLNAGQKQDLLNQINYPQGGSAIISYKASTQYVDDSGNLANKSPYPLFTVSQITNSDGSGNASGFSYQYHGGRYYYNNPFDKQFAGYNLIVQTDSAGNIAKTYYHTANESDST
ncbi:MAG: toxin TcdB middle/N-terminal domain-containing protein, partial [Patescibacteria group bacterium]